MKINISNTFLIVLAIMIATGGFKFFAFLMISCLIHEFGHLIFMYLFGAKVTHLSVKSIGFKLHSFNMHRLEKFKQLLIFSAGSLFNLIFSWIFYKIAISGFYSYNFFILSGMNLYLLLFNLLPISILDGGQILEILLSYIYDFPKSLTLSKNISIIFNLLMIFACIFHIENIHPSLLLLFCSLLFIQK